MNSFIPKINFDKSVHLVGFIIRIYHDARSPERQIQSCVPNKITSPLFRAYGIQFSFHVSLNVETLLRLGCT